MRKMWVKKEYHKPFYKQKLKMSLCFVMLMGLIFFAYQIFYMNQLQFTISPNKWRNTIAMHTNVNSISTEAQRQEDSSRKKINRGIRLRDYDLYNPSLMAMFKCMKSGLLIPIEKVNDDYCDFRRTEVMSLKRMLVPMGGSTVRTRKDTKLVELWKYPFRVVGLIMAFVTVAMVQMSGYLIKMIN